MTAVIAIIADWTGVGDAVGGMVVLILPAVLGATRALPGDRTARELQQMKTSEREQLARELHDTVAHHVSAIAVSAQAGRVLASQQPQAALDALAVVEQEASQTLQELRSMVRVLRDGDADLAPQRGVADIAALGRTDGSVPVHVSVSGDLERPVARRRCRALPHRAGVGDQCVAALPRRDRRGRDRDRVVRLGAPGGHRRRRCGADRAAYGGLRPRRDERTSHPARRFA